ncbi:T9SS type A sorting domain-containing protein [Hymenobacter mucosus]|uniref:Por secretion system C-terminal sorting domain-containing protein n=1 Tax=Hymenobacter mucosus TaxID=1411120 RepID=A0A238YQ59_9BACT|nr:T9SS type A sorting domain-containing protein [Hymenobacter mucosus]SNR73406.1 Por secretion system C-terminal sorting domain-containing protein [Hymenobacter mucosus]
MKTYTFLLGFVAAFFTGHFADAQAKPAKPISTKPSPVIKPATVAAKPAVKPSTTAKPTATTTKPASTAKPVAAPTVATAASAPPSLVTDKMEPVAPNTDALKLRLDTNPVTKRLTVRTNASGPTRVEINDAGGRPVLTRDLMVGTDATVLDVSSLPPGAYLVLCTSGERRGLKRIVLGQ